jgi:hypothetical protein
MAKNQAEKKAAEIVKKYRAVSVTLANKIEDGISAGLSVDLAVRKASEDIGLDIKLQNDITNSAISLVESQAGPVKNKLAMRKMWLNRTWPGEDFSLKRSIAEWSDMADIRESIKASMRAGKAWNGLAKGLSEADLIKADLPSHINQLVNASRRVNPSDIQSIREYRQAVTKSIKAVDKLAQAGAPNTRLKAAYKSVIEATKIGSDKAISRAISQSVEEKMTYNAERIARTEMARAYIQAEYIGAEEDDDVIGMGYDLSDRHPKTDVCDIHTSVDLYGYGPGRYPLSNLPPYPFHPQCLCTAYKIYAGEVEGSKRIDKDKMVKELKSYDQEDRKALLGVQGAKDFAQNPSSWERNLRNYEGYKSIDKLKAPGVKL